MLFFLALPLGALVVAGGLPRAMAELSGSAGQEAISLSLKTTILSTALILVLGTPLAFWISRGRSVWRRTAELVVSLPIALPPAAAGVALLIAFGREGLLKTGAPFTIWAVVMAQMFVASPFFLRAAIGTFSDHPAEIYDVAEADGAGEGSLLLRLGLPMGARSLGGACMIAWARAAGEFGATIIFAGNFPGRTQTMPLAIYLGFESDFQLALALSVLLLIVAAVVLGVAQILLKPSSNGT